VADQTQEPGNPDDDPREAGFGPGEHGDSIEEGREAKDDKQDDDDAGED
jgi:hypothetical protein